MKRKVIGTMCLMIFASLYLASCDYGGYGRFKNEQKDTVYISINRNDSAVQSENRESGHKAYWSDLRHAYMVPPDSSFVLFEWFNGLNSKMIPFDTLSISDQKNNRLLYLTNKKAIYDHLKDQDHTYVLKL